MTDLSTAEQHHWVGRTLAGPVYVGTEAEADEYRRLGFRIDGPFVPIEQLWAAEEKIGVLRAARGGVALLTDPRAFWDAVYPHITEAGPDLSFADCEAITSWLTAHLKERP